MNIFVTVVSRLDDPFLGFYEDMTDENYAHIQLTANQTALVYKVEYSLRKYTRFLYYSRIYKQIEEEIKTIALASVNEKSQFIRPMRGFGVRFFRKCDLESVKGLEKL